MSEMHLLDPIKHPNLGAPLLTVLVYILTSQC